MLVVIHRNDVFKTVDVTAIESIQRHLAKPLQSGPHRGGVFILVMEEYL